MSAKHFLIITIFFVIHNSFPGKAYSGIVLSGFTNAISDMDPYAGGDLVDTINGNGLFVPTPILSSSTHGLSFVAPEDPNSVAFLQTPEVNIYLALKSGVSTMVDSIYLWNLNRGDSRRIARDGSGDPIEDQGNLVYQYLDPEYFGSSGVKVARISYSDDDSLSSLDQLNPLITLNSAAWTNLPTENSNGLFSFSQENGETSTSQRKLFDVITAKYLKITLLENFGPTLVYDIDTNSYVPVNLLGFAEIAFSEYAPPAPPVVPEPGSVAVFGGLMAVGGLMRWRRQRSVGS